MSTLRGGVPLAVGRGMAMGMARQMHVGPMGVASRIVARLMRARHRHSAEKQVHGHESHEEQTHHISSLVVATDGNNLVWWGLLSFE